MQHTNYIFLKTVLSPWQYDLAELSFKLLEREHKSSEKLSDYSFVVFPLAKAYEGFLKDYLLALELIDIQTYHSKRFRIGRVLNPDVRSYQRDEQWLYDDVAQVCGQDVARQLWETWLTCRNHIFHFFPPTDSPLTLTQAENSLSKLVGAIKEALECQRQELRHKHHQNHINRGDQSVGRTKPADGWWRTKSVS